jgi:hypothetical protein
MPSVRRQTNATDRPTEPRNGRGQILLKTYRYNPEPDGFFGSSSTSFFAESFLDSLLVEVEAGSSFPEAECSVNLCHTDFKKPSCLEESVVIDSEGDAVVDLESQNPSYPWRDFTLYLR